MTEFDLIRRYFTRPASGALLGIGDDAALLRVSEGKVLAVSTDMLVGGTHFLPDADPFLLGHKALAVNLSDMAAMGATPRWATLAIALPDADDAWLEKFSAGFFALAQQYGVELVGGDTTRGPLNLCVTIMGEVTQGKALLRSGAQAGDEVWVSGRLGDAALALAHLQRRITLSELEFKACVSALHQPQPRVALGLALCGIAQSAIDISDGLLADLGHILDASHVGAQLEFTAMPVSPAMRGYIGNSEIARQCVLSGGDDYELCFTAPANRHDDVLHIGTTLGMPLTRIGGIVAGQGCIVHDANGEPLDIGAGGYDHFR
jgi:thiamine-monophosphate kinase